MYTIVMNNDKQLVTSVRKTLYQRENLVDQIQFLFPTAYENIDLTELTPVLKYVDIGNVLHSETLAKDSELYKDKIRCILPVDTKLNRFAGNVIIRVIFTKTDMETGKTNEVLKTGECLLSVLGDNTIIYAEDEITEKITALEAQIANIANLQVDELVYNDKDETLQLVAGGVVIGSKISVESMVSEGTPVVNINSDEEEYVPSEDTDVVNF